MAGLVLFSLVLLLATSTLQAVHSCGVVAPAADPDWQSAGKTAAHRAVCVLCANAGTAMPQAAAVHGYFEPAAEQVELAPLSGAVRPSQSYALRVRPPPSFTPAS